MDKIHVLLLGERNVGKSSIMNRLIGEDISIVSDIAGTTTDPVKKSFEIPGIATIVFTDTAGIDDSGDIGQKRVDRSMQMIERSDIVIYVISRNFISSRGRELLNRLKTENKPFFIIYNKTDAHPVLPEFIKQTEKAYGKPVIEYSALKSPHAEDIIKTLIRHIPKKNTRNIVEGIVYPKKHILIVAPIDAGAPCDRLILPQVMTIRHILDKNAIPTLVQPCELEDFMQTSRHPDLVITDSQVFKFVAERIPNSIPLTSFSILMARYKGDFEAYIKGSSHIEHLKTGDRILILESCSHHTSCEDIGRYKLPQMLRKYSGKELEFDFISGLCPLPSPLKRYAMAIQCGGCMVTANQLNNRIKTLTNAGIPISNYGMVIAWINGIFQRAVRPFYT